MIIENNKDKGRAGMALAIAYFGANGYTVSVPLNDTQWYDLVIEKEGQFQTVQCKFTSTVPSKIELKSTGGTNGKAYDSVLDHPLDLLFCANAQLNLFVIPMKDLREAGNKKEITLQSEPPSKFANKNSFSTYKYLVQI